MKTGRRRIEGQKTAQPPAVGLQGWSKMKHESTKDRKHDKNPNAKHQTTNKFQIPLFKSQTPEGCWKLENYKEKLCSGFSLQDLFCLGVGIWVIVICLRFEICDLPIPLLRRLFRQEVSYEPSRRRWDCRFDQKRETLFEVSYKNTGDRMRKTEGRGRKTFEKMKHESTKERKHERNRISISINELFRHEVSYKSGSDTLPGHWIFLVRYSIFGLFVWSVLKFLWIWCGYALFGCWFI